MMLLAWKVRLLPPGPHNCVPVTVSNRVIAKCCLIALGCCLGMQTLCLERTMAVTRIMPYITPERSPISLTLLAVCCRHRGNGDSSFQKSGPRPLASVDTCDLCLSLHSAVWCPGSNLSL